jgi:hypothetical protein
MHVNLISQNVSWFDLLRETDVWAVLTPDEQTKWTERERENTYSQTSWLETPEELQLHHHHGKFPFSTVLLLFAQCKMHNFWLVTWLDSTLLYGSEIWCLREDLINHFRHLYHRCAQTICHIAIAYAIRHRLSPASLFIKYLAMSISTFITIVDFDGQATSPGCH